MKHLFLNSKNMIDMKLFFKFKIQIMIDACFEFKRVVLITFKFKTMEEL